ncbi:MAG TPA: hypothetical protein VF779_12770, partial [Pyrinomonadaceae bacterium]
DNLVPHQQSNGQRERQRGYFSHNELAAMSNPFSTAAQRPNSAGASKRNYQHRLANESFSIRAPLQ